MPRRLWRQVRGRVAAADHGSCCDCEDSPWAPYWPAEHSGFRVPVTDRRFLRYLVLQDGAMVDKKFRLDRSVIERAGKPTCHGQSSPQNQQLPQSVRGRWQQAIALRLIADLSMPVGGAYTVWFLPGPSTILGHSCAMTERCRALHPLRRLRFALPLLCATLGRVRRSGAWTSMSVRL
jgi:hypothetical protein